MSWMTMFLLLCGLWFIQNFYFLGRNFLKARKMGVPIFIVPWNIYNPIVMVFSIPLRTTLERFLPAWMYESIHLTIYGFEFRNQETLHAKYGHTFVNVTAGPIEVNTIDHVLAAEILKRQPQDFTSTDIGGYMMGFFGPNLVTSEGEHWARQRKLIAPNINERFSSIVFDESVKQARAMMSTYLEDMQGVTNETMVGMKTLAINVLGRVGFGISLPWEDEKTQKNSALENMTHMRATKTAVENLIVSAVFPIQLLKLPFLPQTWQAVGRAKEAFPVLTKKMLEKERHMQAESSEPRNNLMGMLVKIADAGQNGDRVTKQTQTLSEEEILGNAFIFTAAGFDTTANTASYAVALLAAYPQWQAWIYEEVSTVLKGMDIDTLDYYEVYPRLPRCLALMYETLRFFTPLTHHAKQVSKDHDVALTASDGRTIVFPRGIIVYINNIALNIDQKTWGKDSKDFRPDRWLNDPSAPAGTTTLASLKTPPKGTYLPWSGGPRLCPGMKMSQVEFVSVIMIMYGFYRCEAVKVRPDETDEEVRERVEGIMKDSQPRLTLQMNRDRDLTLRFIER